MKTRVAIVALAIALVGLRVVPAFADQRASFEPTTEALDVSYCELSRNPAAYNHSLVRITTFATHGFEDFHLADPTCATEGFSVWVMYGGKEQSNTAYCCPGETGAKTRPQSLIVEGIQVPLVDDAKFERFSELLRKEPDTTVRLTVVGRFFSGEKQILNGTAHWGGAGHMGCCSLFVVQRIESFEPHTRTDLDYTSEAGWYEKEGCKFGTLEYQRHVSIPYPDGTTAQVIGEQNKADSGEAAWAFSDPQRVALESLKSLFPGQVAALKRVKTTSRRQVFRWKKGTQQVVIVVTRPYWLSFYAVSDRVVWVATTVKEAGCQ